MYTYIALLLSKFGTEWKIGHNLSSRSGSRNRSDGLVGEEINAPIKEGSTTQGDFDDL